MVTLPCLEIIREWADQRDFGEFQCYSERSALQLSNDWAGSVPVIHFDPFILWGKRAGRPDDTVDILIFEDVTLEQLEAAYAYTLVALGARAARIVVRVHTNA
jgi:hypothetical protein